MYTLWFLSHNTVSCAKNGLNTEDILYILKLVLSPIAEAETIEGLFDVVIGLWTSAGANTEHFAVRDVLFQLSLAEDHIAFGSLPLRTCQQDVGSMASTLQQSGSKCYNVVQGTGRLKEDFRVKRVEQVRMSVTH